MWQATVDMTVWTNEPEPTLESEFTPGADPEWHAWNEWAPEVEVAEFCATLVEVLDPTIIVETGVSQGFITRRLVAALTRPDQGVYAFEADDNIRSRIPVAIQPDPIPPRGLISQADLLVLDSHWPERIQELDMWETDGKPGSWLFMHDVNRRHPAGSGHWLMAKLVDALRLPAWFFDNPRGSALVYKGGHQ